MAGVVAAVEALLAQHARVVALARAAVPDDLAALEDLAALARRRAGLLEELGDARERVGNFGALGRRELAQSSHESSRGVVWWAPRPGMSDRSTSAASSPRTLRSPAMAARRERVSSSPSRAFSRRTSWTWKASPSDAGCMVDRGSSGRRRTEAGGQTEELRRQPSRRSRRDLVRPRCARSPPPPPRSLARRRRNPCASSPCCRRRPRRWPSSAAPTSSSAARTRTIFRRRSPTYPCSRARRPRSPPRPTSTSRSPRRCRAASRSTRSTRRCCASSSPTSS